MRDRHPIHNTGRLLRRAVLLAVRLIAIQVFLTTVAELRAQDHRSAQIRFQDVTANVNMTFRHVSPLTEQRHTHLTMGSGVGWVDIDNDTRPDLYCCQGHVFSLDGRQTAGRFFDEIWRNQPDGTFHKIPFRGPSAYSMGVTCGDFNNDGFIDLYVTGFHAGWLLQNNGDGTFEQTPLADRLNRKQWGAGCTWIDENGDGNLDLYVANYLKIDPQNYQLCKATHLGKTVYITCHPRRVPPEPDMLCRNTGSGQFEDISEDTGILSVDPRQGLGVIAADLDRDGDTDLYVANDSVENQLWRNENGRALFEEGFLTGTALNRAGQREAGMGIAIADYDANRQPDLFVTNFFAETNTLYRNEGGLFFLDVTDETGVAEPGRLRLGFGTCFLDADNDFWPDLFVANGHVHDQLVQLGRNEPFAQRPLLMQNREGLRFEDISDAGGPYFNKEWVGRGSASADFDADGRIDLAIQHLDGPLRILQNQSSSTHKWVRVTLVGTTSNRSAAGATIDVTINDRTRAIPVVCAGSYLSADDITHTIGTGTADKVRITVQWPYGKTQSWQLLSGSAYVLIQDMPDSYVIPQ